MGLEPLTHTCRWNGGSKVAGISGAVNSSYLNPAAPAFAAHTPRRAAAIFSDADDEADSALALDALQQMLE